jgi:rubredoxin
MGDENDSRPEGEAPGGERDGAGADEDDRDAREGRPRRHRADETLRTGALPDAVECPHCGETESEQFSTFGSAVSVSQYYCRSCRTVFEFFKWR